MMHHPTPPAEENRQLFLKVLGMYDAPGFARRARRIEDADRLLAQHLGQKRTEYLWMVSLRIGQLRALAGDWPALAPLFDKPEALGSLRRLHDELQPVLRLPLEPTRSLRKLRQMLEEMAEAMARFNERWHKY